MEPRIFSLLKRPDEAELTWTLLVVEQPQPVPLSLLEDVARRPLDLDMCLSQLALLASHVLTIHHLNLLPYAESWVLITGRC